jgi:hypothetical protein
MLYLMKAKILQREGKLPEAAEQANVARVLDLQDKYLNGKAAKYMFRAGDIDGAEQTMQLFFKASPVNDAFLTALESQCAWYSREVGHAFMNKGDYISALQNLLMYEKHVVDNNYELLEFQTYTLRRANLLQLVDALSYQDRVESHKLFLLVAPAIVRCYMSIDELGEEKTRAQHSPRAAPIATGLVEEDKHRAKLYQDLMLKVDISKPLEKAVRYVEALVLHRGSIASTHELAINFFIRAKRSVPAARSLLALFKINPAAAQAKLPHFSSSFESVPNAVRDVLLLVK